MRTEPKVCRDCERLLDIKCFRHVRGRGFESACEECRKKKRDATFADRENRRRQQMDVIIDGAEL